MSQRSPVLRSKFKGKSSLGHSPGDSLKRNRRRQDCGENRRQISTEFVKSRNSLNKTTLDSHHHQHRLNTHMNKNIIFPAIYSTAEQHDSHRARFGRPVPGCQLTQTRFGFRVCCWILLPGPLWPFCWDIPGLEFEPPVGWRGEGVQSPPHRPAILI